VPASAFRPEPAVDGAHIAVERRVEPLLHVRERRSFDRFVRLSFEHGGRLRAGLRAQLTNNQVRRLRTVVSFTDTTLCSTVDAESWIALYREAKPYLNGG
jgi:16S rRNA A1518/A1519 N6-dimethyltransferase RsmA/KsgA/DIM1 with predicted DNA glycosylase/AP lyase activity